MHAAKAQASLCMCTALPEPSLLDDAIITKNLVRWSLCVITLCECYTVNPVLSGHSKRPKMVFKTEYCLMQVWPSLRYHLTLRSLFCLLRTGFTVCQSYVSICDNVTFSIKILFSLKA